MMKECPIFIQHTNQYPTPLNVSNCIPAFSCK